jgi:hypothetical protein
VIVCLHKHNAHTCTSYLFIRIILFVVFSHRSMIIDSWLTIVDVAFQFHIVYNLSCDKYVKGNHSIEWLVIVLFCLRLRLFYSTRICWNEPFSKSISPAGHHCLNDRMEKKINRLIAFSGQVINDFDSQYNWPLVFLLLCLHQYIWRHYTLNN